MTRPRRHPYDPVLDGFTPQTIRDFLKVGVYPPPYCGDHRDPKVLIMCLASQEQFLDPPRLDGTDEAGVIKQMLDFEARATRVRERVAR